jgi:uncharacterized protein
MTSAVSDNPQRSRYELAVEGGIAFIDYQRVGRLRLLTHTEVPPALRRRGVGARLTAGALQLVGEQGERIEVRCSYVAQFITRNPQFRDLLAQP